MIILSYKKVIATNTQYYENASIYGYVKYFYSEFFNHKLVSIYCRVNLS